MSRRAILKGGILSAATPGLGNEVSAQSPQHMHISSSSLRAHFNGVTGQLVLAANNRVFATGGFTAPGQNIGVVHELPIRFPFAPGLVMELAPGENRIVIGDSLKDAW